MEEQKQKSEYALQVRALADQATGLIEKYPGCGIILLSAEKCENGYNDVVAAVGGGRELVECVTTLASTDQTMPFFMDGLKMASFKKFSQAFGLMVKDQQEYSKEQEQKDNN